MTHRHHETARHTARYLTHSLHPPRSSRWRKAALEHVDVVVVAGHCEAPVVGAELKVAASLVGHFAGVLDDQPVREEGSRLGVLLLYEVYLRKKKKT